MTRSIPRFGLSTDPDGLGLNCDETGLTLAGVALLRKDDGGFSPRTPEEIAVLLRQGYGEGQGPAVPSTSVLASVADALNRGDLAKAAMTAVFLKLPDLDADGAVRMILADDALAKYSPDQARDDHGRWTDGGAEEDSARNPAPAPAHENPQGGVTGDTAAPSNDDPPTLPPGDPHLELVNWIPPASRSPFPLGPKGPPSGPKFTAPGPTIHEIIGEGSPRDTVGVVEDYLGMLRDIQEIGVGEMAASMSNDRRISRSLQWYAFSDGKNYQGLTFGDPSKTHFVWLPVFPEGRRLLAFKTPPGTHETLWTSDGTRWRSMSKDPPLLRP